MGRPKNKGIYREKRGVCGEKQMELKDYENIKKVLDKVSPPRKTYPQDWDAYNLAKTQEKTISLQLLMELLENIEEDKKSDGRPPFSLREQVICMFVYCYCGFSGRRAISDLNSLKERKILTKVPHFNTIFNMFKSLKMIKLLSELVEITSMPLRMFEENFVIDSTGFSTSIFERWFDIRTQSEVRKRSWMKVHLICGARTNIITSIAVTNGTVADCPQLVSLVENTSKRFDMKELSADKAYLSRANLIAVASAGAIPFIPFKSNSRKTARGTTLWRQMWLFFYENQEEFMKHYHQRSKVETTFSMVKRCYGNHLRMRTETSQINEVLMKCLCHNLAVLVQESFELGINIDFKKCAEDYFAQEHS